MRCFVIFVIQLLQWDLSPNLMLWKRKMNTLGIRICCNIFECEITHFSLWKTILSTFIMLLSTEATYYLEVFLFPSNSLFPPSPQGNKPEDRDQPMAPENDVLCGRSKEISLGWHIVIGDSLRYSTLLQVKVVRSKVLFAPF